MTHLQRSIISVLWAWLIAIPISSVYLPTGGFWVWTAVLAASFALTTTAVSVLTILDRILKE